MRFTFTIPGRLPGMNEMIDAARDHWGKSSGMKARYTGECALAIGRLFKTPLHRVMVDFEWFEPNDNRDPDNIMAGQKFILDAMVKKNVLSDDNRKEIRAISHRFHTDAQNPRVEVTVCEVD